MIYSYIKKNTRKTVPIYKKINPIKFMHLTKVFGKISSFSYTCQLLTRNSENTWIFKYQANHDLSITIHFCDKSTDPYAYIMIDVFRFPEKYSYQNLDDKILRVIINHIQSLDFEMLIFQLKETIHVDLCKRNGFKESNIHQMIMSIKPKFIQY
ncbi:hypothetical protein [Marinisporobacter balticus]|uniref:Acetyltransferase (GNAT) family protein n=1 Tax=Marinisporobacter balticus TaxID=2018667 RepID=A0A4R2KXM3_9FIRM|nr:hypothetical protein [Marinisporobacter balticus]TCO79351.1 hypothetical protein EV214_10269 [Marinisporobacter balticus]